MSKETLTIDQVEEIYQLIKYAFYLLDVGYYFFDEEGNDVTPEKLKQLQRERGLHGRSLDDPNS